MFRSLTFRQKIFASQFFLFIFFLILLFPFGQKVVTQIVQHALDETSYDLIRSMKEQKDEESLVNYLKTQELFVFFRMSLINQDYQLLYDTHLERKLGEKYIPLYPTQHEEVTEAFQTGTGYAVDWSEAFQTKFAYVAVRFDFQGKLYVLRTAFPFSQLQILTRNFQIGIFAIGILFLIMFSFFTWLIFSRISRPIHAIIDAIKPYQEGREESIPKIELEGVEQDEFNQLAKTLNTLSERIKQQISRVVEEMNEKEAILESLVEGVVAIDGEGLVRYVNGTGAKMMGLSKRHLLGKNFSSQNAGPKASLIERCGQLLKIATERHEVVIDSIALSSGAQGTGPKLYLDLIAAPKPYRSGAILVIQDKSSQHKVIEMGKDFVANASHELRTPITIIHGFAETLQDLPKISKEMLIDITEKIVRNCQRMETLIKNLLTLSDIDNIPETKFINSDVCDVLENCRHMVLAVHPTATIEIKKEKDEIKAPIDPDLMELAIMNLLDNAVKYSKPPARVTISISSQKNDVKITIADQGIGIPEEDVDKIFERFFTVDKAHSRRLGGAGLGLSIVKTIITKHEGTIQVQSIVGKGSTFTILLPRHRHGLEEIL